MQSTHEWLTSSNDRMSRLNRFEQGLFEERSKLLSHGLFSAVKDLQSTRKFMEAHIFAVWDFMSLVKSLQLKLTCVSVPWLPPTHPEAARFINEIVLGEESDEIAPGSYISHFDLYLAAMNECGADTRAINQFISQVRAGTELVKALELANAPSLVMPFVTSTFEFCSLEVHEIAAAFLYGREDVIPDMFNRILANSSVGTAPQFKLLKLYLERHIQVDGESHGPMARQMMQSLCGDSPKLWADADRVARQALRSRRELWDRVLAGLSTSLSPSVDEAL